MNVFAIENFLIEAGRINLVIYKYFSTVGQIVRKIMQ